MADIYLARSRDEEAGPRLVVIKELLPELALEPRFLRMLRDEATIASRLVHPNVAHVLGIEEEDGQLFLAMDYVEGIDLRELLGQCTKRKLDLPVRYRLHILCEVLKALAFAHGFVSEDETVAGVIHRDVSPSNVLLAFDGQVKLCDFGIASALNVAAVPAETIEGKASYMSPEQARGDVLDVRSDVFSAGILAWELLQGRRMYRAREGESLIELSRRAETPKLAPRGLPEEEVLFAIVSRALAVEPEDRFPSAASLRLVLARYLENTEQAVTSGELGGWLSEHFAEQKLARRRARERVLAALDRGPAVVLTAIRDSQAGRLAEADGWTNVRRARDAAPPPSAPRDSAPPPPVPRDSAPPQSLRDPEPPSSRGATRPSSRPKRGSPVASGAIAFAVTLALLGLLAKLGVV